MKKTVFISSTYEDLAVHRQAVWQVLKSFNVGVRGMEEFGARTEGPLETCLAEVEQSDVYLGILAFKLGSVDSSSEKSFTQLEYEHALKLKKEILIYLADEQESVVKYTDIDIDPTLREKLQAFKRVLVERHTINRFSAPEDLAEKLRRDFARYFDPTELDSTRTENESESTLRLVKDFLIMPKSVLGREARFNVSFYWDPYPASRSLCHAFKLDYGMTIGADIRVESPTMGKERIPFSELYATGTRANKLLELAQKKEPVDLYARLQFTEQDISSPKAILFGHSYYDTGDDYGDPNEHYVAPEGRSILLFSKAA
jgi:hypothetical protein